jgi:hypothetical protein
MERLLSRRGGSTEGVERSRLRALCGYGLEIQPSARVQV